MVSEPDARRCVSLLAIGVDTMRCASKDTEPQRGGFGGGPTFLRERNECSEDAGPQRGSPKRGRHEAVCE